MLTHKKKSPGTPTVHGPPLSRMPHLHSYSCVDTHRKVTTCLFLPPPMPYLFSNPVRSEAKAGSQLRLQLRHFARRTQTSGSVASRGARTASTAGGVAGCADVRYSDGRLARRGDIPKSPDGRSTVQWPSSHLPRRPSCRPHGRQGSSRWLHWGPITVDVWTSSSCRWGSIY